MFKRGEMTFKRKPKQAGKYKGRSAGWPAPLPGATHVGTARIRESHAIVMRGNVEPESLARLAALAKAHASGPLVAAETSRGKYGNRKCEADGITFDSQKERERYHDLKRFERIGKISNLRLQVRYEIAPAVRLDGRKRPARYYVADFVYEEDGAEVVEDSKGYRTPEYRLKRHLMKACHGIEIREV